ncbi:hypothetical protein BV25DRAFT_1842871 [Artomyces pyxidatus]|uniref:Uncharacterized protein n=1 Tax=Artomyces pyxidatus TaxID=48021 RepID=A0ACB8SIH5_9AGAM|nr:hypothetical protein BV25DRAFT_1842871 [Artomyces pyxidatus]
MDHLDTSWCPVCSRQILPKRYLVPVLPIPNPHPAPAPPPSSPSSASPEKSTSPDAPARQARRSGTIRAKGGGGLVRGTGRVKPNGALKRVESTKAPLPPPIPTVPVKHRTVIDQAPTPLYCSDECRVQDFNSVYGVISPDYNPDRHPRESPTLPPVPHNSLTGISPLDSELASSPDSTGSITDSERRPFDYDSPIMTKSVAKLMQMYDMPALPPRPPLLDEEEDDSAAGYASDYQTGVIMAARRIKDALCPDPASKRTVRPTSQSGSRERKPIPGWTDGTDAWRASVYSFSSASENHSPRSDSSFHQPERSNAYGSFVASPHRASAGVYSTLTDGESGTPTTPSTRRSSTAEELYSNYPLSFSRRNDSRSSIAGSVPQPHSLPVAARRREHSILKPGAEGKLLVPDVKLRPSGGSMCSIDGSSMASWRSGSTRSLARSPLSRFGSEASVESESIGSVLKTAALETPIRPKVETRSWSYDNVLTYPAMPMPPRRETRFERREVDGVPTVVETEVEVQPQMKRLFLFPGKESSSR